MGIFDELEQMGIVAPKMVVTEVELENDDAEIAEAYKSVLSEETQKLAEAIKLTNSRWLEVLKFNDKLTETIASLKVELEKTLNDTGDSKNDTSVQS